MKHSHRTLNVMNEEMKCSFPIFHDILLWRLVNVIGCKCIYLWFFASLIRKFNIQLTLIDYFRTTAISSLQKRLASIQLLIHWENSFFVIIVYRRWVFQCFFVLQNPLQKEANGQTGDCQSIIFGPSTRHFRVISRILYPINTFWPSLLYFTHFRSMIVARKCQFKNDFLQDRIKNLQNKVKQFNAWYFVLMVPHNHSP